MKVHLFRALIFLLMGTSLASAQGTLLLDQYSSLDETAFPNSGTRIQQFATPFGQSFTPTFSGIDFVRLNLNDANKNNGLGATINLTLHSESMFGPVIGSSTPLSLSDNSAGVSAFFFPATIALNSGVTYYLEISVASGDDWAIITGGYGYPGGSLVVSGIPGVGSDAWFQEGIVVPEPSSVALIVFGGGLFWFGRKKFAGR